jgi:hypothetical protein
VYAGSVRIISEFFFMMAVELPPCFASLQAAKQSVNLTCVWSWPDLGVWSWRVFDIPTEQRWRSKEKQRSGMT